MRHPYSTNSQERFLVPSALAILAVFASLGIGALLRQIDWVPPVWLDVSSVMLLYAAFLSFFQRVAWKWKWLRSVTRISTPILEGEWAGAVQSGFDGAVGAPSNVTVHIGQDWTEIVIRLVGQYSKSHSTSASMLVTEDECVLIYDYLNEPNQDAVESMHMHRGTARLILVNNDRLEGEYYTGRDRKNTGSIRLRRQE